MYISPLIPHSTIVAAESAIPSIASLSSSVLAGISKLGGDAEPEFSRWVLLLVFTVACRIFFHVAEAVPSL